MATQEATLSELDRRELLTALELLGKANEKFEALNRHLNSGVWGEDRETAWMLEGFTNDALLDLSELTRHVIEIREKIKGGLTEKEHELREAFENV